MLGIKVNNLMIDNWRNDYIIPVVSIDPSSFSSTAPLRRDAVRAPLFALLAGDFVSLLGVTFFATSGDAAPLKLLRVTRVSAFVVSGLARLDRRGMIVFV